MPIRTALLMTAAIALAAPAAGQIPKVALSEHHREMCRVGVGDTMPKAELETPNGDPQLLAKLYGRRATVVVFYQTLPEADQPANKGARHGWMTQTLLGDIGPDVAEAYGKSGVTLVAVSIDAEPAGVGGALSLVDPGGRGFAKLGTGRLPRLYLLDPDGKILWLDIEYSNSTRRELKLALDAITGAASVARARE